MSLLGGTASGWHMRNVHLPARVRADHSETAYMTDQAITYMRRMGDEPWVLHLSYVGRSSSVPLTAPTSWLSCLR